MTRIEFALAVVRKIYRDLATPSDFKKDWYGWLTNQCAHFLFGVALTAVISFAFFFYLGAFAHKGVLFGLVAVIVLATQYRSFWLKFWDTVEDIIFMLVYGAGSAVLLFNETAPGSPKMLTSIEAIGPLSMIVSAHLAAGSVFRAAKEVRSG